MYTYFILAMLFKTDVVDVSMLGSHYLLRIPAHKVACQAGDVVMVEERVPSVKTLGTMEWSGDYLIECSMLRDRYIKAPQELVKLLERK